MNKKLILLTFFALLLSFTKDASAIPFDFERITSNAPADIASQFSVDLSDAGAGQILFLFSNVGPVASFIAQVYFDDDNSLLSSLAISPVTSAGVSFSSPTAPPSLPGGNTVGFAADFSAGKVGAAANGVNIGEVVGILFSADYNLVLAAMLGGDLKVGIHVQGIGTGDFSDSFVTTEVPEPASMMLLATGALGARLARRRKKA